MTLYRNLQHLLFLLLLRFFHGSSLLVFKKTSAKISVSCFTVNQRQPALMDGAELESLNQYFHSQSQPMLPQTMDEDSSMESTSFKMNVERKIKLGLATLISGTVHGTQDRVVGILKQEKIPPLNPQAKESLLQDLIQVDLDTFIYKESMAYIPVGVSDSEAIQTLMASLVGVHCVFYPTIHNVGGSSDTMVLNLDGRTVVVLGGGNLGTFISDALSILGAEVFQITNSKISNRKLASAVTIQSPLKRVGDIDIGFADSVVSFDVIVDCMSDESKSLEDTSIILRELKRRHGCQRYVSTISHSQRIVRDEGLLFGPKSVEKYLQDAASLILSNNSMSSTMDLFSISPPVGFGRTLQQLLDARSLFTQRQEFQNIVCRKWSLQEFLELTLWPSDTRGALRFGFPIPEDIERLLSDDPRERPLKQKKQAKIENESESDDESEPLSNSFVTQISSLDELDRAVVSEKKTCLIFLAASYCRTCKALTPKFKRLARHHVEGRRVDITFFKADVTGASGKGLSRVLDVDAVPAFVMFRRGKLYGEPLSVSRIPSKKLELAIKYLVEGKQWDKKVFSETIDS